MLKIIVTILLLIVAAVNLVLMWQVFRNSSRTGMNKQKYPSGMFLSESPSSASVL